MYLYGVPVIPHNPSPGYRKKWDAFQVLDNEKCSPLKKAIEAALKIEDPNERCHAWLAIASFVYAKPKQQIDVSGSVTLEQVLAASLALPSAS